ncbi:MAG: TSUP family transporter [Gammaproteobacteria bacterium]
MFRFSIPAALAAVVGAGLLSWFDRLPVLLRYSLGGGMHEITVVKAVIGVLIIAFALLELSPRFQALVLPPRYLFCGGLLSGFFGGLSGAFRSAFLIKAGLSKEAFVATGVVSAVIVDAVRLVVYGVTFLAEHFARSQELIIPVVVGTACAFIGAVLGKRLLRKITLRAVQVVVAVMMLLVGGGLATGLI